MYNNVKYNFHYDGLFFEFLRVFINDTQQNGKIVVICIPNDRLVIQGQFCIHYNDYDYLFRLFVSKV